MKARAAVALSAGATIAFVASAAAGTVAITAETVRDNTLFEDAALSNGAGEHFFAGRTNAGTLDIRRGLIAFDVESAGVPPGSVIESVTLTLHMSRTIVGPQPVALRRVLADWGEGTSDAPGEEGGGAPATSGDATWSHTFFPDSFWSSAGGDFAGSDSASTSVDGIGYYTWSGAGMVADVEAWLDETEPNHGWILLGDETTFPTGKRFDTKENGTSEQRPVLEIVYSPVGACYDADGSCEIETEDICIASDRTYGGDGTPCDLTPTKLIIDSIEDRCFVPTGGLLHVTLSMADLDRPAAGFQAFLDFDERLSFMSGEYTTEPFGTPILFPIVAVGNTIDLAAGTQLLPSGQDALLATLTFEVLDGDGVPSVGFRKHVPPTTLVDANAVPIQPLTLRAFQPECPADFDRNGVVEFPDIILILSFWEQPCGADANGDETVDFGDLIVLLKSWGPCPGPLGACCFPDGSCEVFEEPDCVKQGGIYEADGINCVDAMCRQPTGACCFIDGSCLELEEDDCTAQMGAYAGDEVTCMGAMCPQPTGACCFADGSCQVLEEADCIAMSGAYDGDDVTCLDAMCPQPTGACCAPDGSCMVLEPADCAGMGGTYAGDDVTCVDADCQPTGACCFDDGACQVLEEGDCTGMGGTYAGNGVTCVDAMCPQPTGACCFADGSCMILEQGDCTGTGGTYAGDDVTCIDANCPQPATGACCLDDGLCEITSEADCTTQGGMYQGDDVPCEFETCPIPTGACCFVDGSCEILSEAMCVEQSGTYAGQDVTCLDADCPQPTGACCFDDGSCQVLEEADCIGMGGTYAGDDVTCVAADCMPTGACCFADGSCQVLEELDCTGMSGTYAGDLVTCVTADCMPTGACCFADGSCQVLEETDCIAMSGTYAGDLVTCVAADCMPTGACCFADGSCQVLEELDCTGMSGTYAGDLVTCVTADCMPTGACCFADGSCQVLEELDCTGMSGTYAGDLVTCVTADCMPTGACCFADGSCQVLEELDCIAMNGTYAGDLVTCVAANCPPPTITEVRVSASSDDAEENSVNGAMLLTSADLELAVSVNTDTVGMRFTGLAIPAGATIVEAWIQFETDEVSTGAVALSIRGQADDNGATFTSATGDITSRTRTSASVAWAPPDWDTVGEQGVNQRTPDLSAVVQEIVDRGGWSSGNALVVIVDGTGTRIAESFDGVPGSAPLLHVSFGE